MLVPYRPDHFAKTYKTHNGPSIWQWLHTPEVVQIMEVASYLRRPAVEALSPYLIAQFGARMRSNSMKQMVGHMVRQVLEQRGYRLDRSNMRIRRPGNIFFSGSAYVAPDYELT